MLRLFVAALLVGACAYHAQAASVTVATPVGLPGGCVAASDEAATPAGYPTVADAFRVALRMVSDEVALRLTGAYRATAKLGVECRPVAGADGLVSLRITADLPGLKEDQVPAFVAGLKKEVETGRLTTIADAYVRPSQTGIQPSSIRISVPICTTSSPTEISCTTASALD